YRPLGSSTREIRLLKIVNAEKLEEGGPIRCSLHVVPLSDATSFTALSYVWGESGSTEEVWMDGSPVQVRANLTVALRWTPYHWLRHFPGRPVSELRIWADALCIDQQNLSERNHQVAMMGDIYTQTEVVMSSIASENPSIRLALETYRDIHATLKAHRRSGPSPMAIEGWTALCNFSALHYWRRVWIIQEV
ncbi:heterokaryon incompatibility protein-domain-containing protein, partial [Diaporthe sp. PMI_573]